MQRPHGVLEYHANLIQFDHVIAKKLFCARTILRVSRNTSSGNFEFFSMGASHLDDIFKLNATKFAQIG